MKINISKLTACIMSAALIISLCVPVFAAETSETLNVTVAADLHFNAAGKFGDMSTYSGYDAENPFWYMVNDGQLEAEAEAIARAMLDDFAVGDSRILLLPGDLTNGFADDHEYLAELLAETERSTGKRIFVISGNHDISPLEEGAFASAEEFRSCYYEFGYSEALSEDTASLSYTAELDGKYRLLAIDSCVYGESNGALKGETLEWISRQCEKARLDGKVLIAMMHHSAMSHFLLEPVPDNSAKLVDILGEYGVKYVFTGHMHNGEISSCVASNGTRVYDIMTSSLISYPCCYRTARFGSVKTEIETHKITAIDTSYLPEGMSEKQILLIASDFEGYVSDYLTAYMKYWITANIGSGEKACASLGLKEGSAAYEALDSVMDILGEALYLPLYNTGETTGSIDTIEEIAAAYGYTLPVSGYKYIYEAAAKIMGGFYSGDTALNNSSIEMKLVYSAINCALAYSFNTVLQREVLTPGMAQLVSKLNCEIASNEYLFPVSKFLVSRKCANVIADALISSLAIGIISDAFGPENINVTLEGVDVTAAVDEQTAAPKNVFEKIIAFFRSFFETLRSRIPALW